MIRGRWYQGVPSKTIEEMIKDDEIRAVEDAMSRALMRTCPRCGVSYLKQDGCALSISLHLEGVLRY